MANLSPELSSCQRSLFRGSRGSICTIANSVQIVCSSLPSAHSISEASTPHGLLLVSWFQDLEGTHEGVIHGHHCSRVVKFATIVRRREQRHQLAIAKEFVAVLDDLMRATNQVDFVLVRKFLHDVLAKSERDASVIVTPICHFFVWV